MIIRLWLGLPEFRVSSAASFFGLWSGWPAQKVDSSTQKVI